MHRRNSYTLISLSISLWAIIIQSSCNQEFKEFRNTTQIEGRATTFDELGRRNTDHSGVSLFIKNSEILPALSDPEGHFFLTDVLSGTYDVEAIKEGYGSVIKYGMAFFGGKGIETITMSIGEKSTTSIQNVEVVDTEISMVVFRFNFNLNASLGGDFRFLLNFRFFLGADDNTGPENYRWTGSRRFLMQGLSEGVLQSSLSYPSDLFKDSEFIYLVIYGTNTSDFDYEDPFDGRKIYNTLGPPSQIVKFNNPYRHG